MNIAFTGSHSFLRPCVLWTIVNLGEKRLEPGEHKGHTLTGPSPDPDPVHMKEQVCSSQLSRVKKEGLVLLRAFSIKSSIARAFANVLGY